jgi:hypothetical protein
MIVLELAEKLPDRFVSLPNIHLGRFAEIVQKRIEAWEHALTVGKLLPTLPIWLAEDLVITLDLESSYEKTCKAIRIR